MTLEQQIAETVERTAERVLAGAEDRIVSRVLAEMGRRWPEPDGWLTRRELAAQLEVAIDTVDRRIAAGDTTIEVTRVGRAVRCRLRPPVTNAEVAAMAADAVLPQRATVRREMPVAGPTTPETPTR